MNNTTPEPQRFNFGLVLVVIAILSLILGVGFLLTPEANAASRQQRLTPPTSATIDEHNIGRGMKRYYDHQTGVVCYTRETSISCVKL